MRFPELVEGRLLRRYKRFLADVLLDSGEEVTAHCANPGSMKSLLSPPPRVWLSRARPGRKLAYTWEVADLGETKVFVNPVLANQVVKQALLERRIAELQAVECVIPEARFSESTRFDFLLAGGGEQIYLEVKNVTLGLGEGRTAFPDSVSARGAKHLQELVRAREQGFRAILFFCVAREDATSVEAARDIDPIYADELAKARASGVEVLAYAGEISRSGFSLSRRVPVLES